MASLTSATGRLRAWGAAHVSPLAALGVAVLAVSTSAPLVRAGSAPAPVTAFYRISFTVLLLAPFLRGRGGSFRAFGRRDLAAAAFGGVALAVHFVLWFESVDLTTVAASTTLVQTKPLFVALGAAFLLGERLTRRMVAGLLVAAVGALVMSGGDLVAGAPAPILGDGLAVAAAVASAVYVLVGRSTRQRVSVLPYVMVVYGVCALVLFAVTLVEGLPLLGYPPAEWAIFLALAAGPGVLGHTVVNWALGHLESSVVSVTLVGEPVVSAAIAVVAFAEVPSLATLVGAPLALAGIAATVRGRERR